GRWVALGGGGYAVVDVVPVVWAALVAEAAHVPLPPGTVVPEVWRELVRRELGAQAPVTMDDTDPSDPDVFRPWSRGYDPESPVDRAVMATRSAAFPLRGLHPEAF